MSGERGVRGEAQRGVGAGAARRLEQTLEPVERGGELARTERADTAAVALGEAFCCRLGGVEVALDRSLGGLGVEVGEIPTHTGREAGRRVEVGFLHEGEDDNLPGCSA